VFIGYDSLNTCKLDIIYYYLYIYYLIVVKYYFFDFTVSVDEKDFLSISTGGAVYWITDRQFRLII